MQSIHDLVQTIIRLRKAGKAKVTLLAACPNSEAVLQAAIKVAARNRMPMLFAATLNQVDLDGGYTGWTPGTFVAAIKAIAQKYNWEGPLFPCLDHGGPWLKDRHTLEGLAFQETLHEVKQSLSACLEAGYSLLHVDPTVDRSLAPGQTLPVEQVVQRTLEMIAYAEAERVRLGLSEVAYEVGTEEVHGGLVDFSSFETFLHLLRKGLEAQRMLNAWPAFVVAQVGTNLDTTFFDPDVARKLFEIVAPLGSLVKGHYTDWVDNPSAYPATGMGGANIGPEFTAAEFLALQDLEMKEKALLNTKHGLLPSRFMNTLERAVVVSGRWKKWLQPDEKGKEFGGLLPERRTWLAQTGARYVWAQPEVKAARQQLYTNLSLVMEDPNEYVVDRIAGVMDRYVNAFNLINSNQLFGLCT